MDTRDIEMACELYKNVSDEKALANIFVLVENKAWWLEDDIYDFEEGTAEHEEISKRVELWFSLGAQIRENIFSILTKEGVIIPESGQRAVLTPFMNRNGYINGNGWWIEAAEVEV